VCVRAFVHVCASHPLYQSNQCLLLSMAIVLQCGNLMNASSSLGKAAGFKLDILERLSHVKGACHLPISKVPTNSAEFSSTNISGAHDSSDGQQRLCREIGNSHRALRLKHTRSASSDKASLLSYVALRLPLCVHPLYLQNPSWNHKFWMHVELCRFFLLTKCQPNCRCPSMYQSVVSTCIRPYTSPYYL
jgi:hypothetical protein